MKIIIGKFTGWNMIGEDGQWYGVPENYASKSKLLVGDTLKLCIDETGKYVYKQIDLVPRNRALATVTQVGKDCYVKIDNGMYYKILNSTARYYKLEVGDEVGILFPDGSPTYAAVENLIGKKNY